MLEDFHLALVEVVVGVVLVLETEESFDQLLLVIVVVSAFVPVELMLVETGVVIVFVFEVAQKK